MNYNQTDSTYCSPMPEFVRYTGGVSMGEGVGAV
jgi:hypothetical protein